MAVALGETLPSRLDATAARCSERPALTLGDKTLTYGELAQAVRALSASLAALGVRPGQRAAVLFPNCPQFVISYFAVLQTGATVLPLHCLQGPQEIAYILSNSGAETLLALNAFSPLLEAVRPQVPSLKRVIVSGETALPDALPFEGLLEPSAGPVPTPSVADDDVSTLIYTSGTTGRPKGAMLTHRNLIADAEACCEIIRITDEDVFGTVLPLFHCFGATVCLILPILTGAHSVMIPKFSPLTVLETLERTRGTIFAGVPSMFAVMLQMRTERRFDLDALRIAVSGGAPLPVEVLHGFEQRFGANMIEGYGPTEASPVVCVNPPGPARKVGTVGPPLPGVRVKIVDDDLHDVPAGTAGEVCVAGPTVMQGYWQDPDATAATLRDGWLLTGDIGSLDEDGYLSIVDRKKDMIIVGGMNVYPREVEDVIYKLDPVAEVAVVGVPNRLRGEDIIAFIRLKEDAQLDPQTVITHCQAQLANYKVPRSVEFRDEFPRSGTGKVLKRVLRQEQSASPTAP